MRSDHNIQFLIQATKRSHEFAASLHASCGKTYGNDKLPYSHHLKMVKNFVVYFSPLLKDSAEAQILSIAADMHDSIEDCGITFNDVKSEFGEEVADVVYNVTNELGKNRKERHERTLPKIKSDRRAIYLKLCDRIANTVFSKFVDGSMYGKYVAEWPEFKEQLYTEEFKPMFDYYEKLIELK